MTRCGLLEACLCLLAIGAVSKPNPVGPCKPLEGTDEGATEVRMLLGGRAALITCGEIQQLALCLDNGRWSTSVSSACSGIDRKRSPLAKSDDAQELQEFLEQEFLAKSGDGQRLLEAGFSAKSEDSQEVSKSRLRVKRNTGKYQDLRRRVKVQRQIRAGLLETRIDTSIPSIFRARPLGNVYLACRIENLGSHSVTWIRRRDNNVLAIDSSSISLDRRLAPSHEEKTDTWLLGIHGVRDSDAGLYECRVSTRRPMKRLVTLQVVPADQPLHGPVQSEDHGLDFVLRNITALWEEIQDVRQEIVQHLHEGHDEEGHDRVVKEVETLHHEHHVHHLHHPHPGHNDHHDAALLQHLEEDHGHIDDHSEGQPLHGHIHGHGHSHDHHHDDDGDDDDDGDGGEDHSEEEDDDDHDGLHRGDHAHGHAHHEAEDAHDAHGLHSHEDEHEYGHEHGHSHSSDSHDHDDHTDDHSRSGAPRAGLALIPGRARPEGAHDIDPWMHASCTLKPNVDAPESNVRGSIVISQRKDEDGPVYFDLHITGMDVASTGKIHGFHVHERQVTDEKCGSTGGHFNPGEVVHGAPEDDVRHVGDLGNIEVGDDGELRGYIIADDKVAFKGSNSIIGKSIVVHAGVDDLGKGGDSGSLATGNAGGRLACCTIYIVPELYRRRDNFRFKGK